MVKVEPKYPIVSYIGGGRIEVREPITVYLDGAICNNFTIPKGYVCNGPTIPRMLTPIFPRLEDSFYPAIIHDYLYDTGIFDKEVSDELFLALMYEYDVKPWRARNQFRAVDWFGQGNWDKCRGVDG